MIRIIAEFQSQDRHTRTLREVLTEDFNLLNGKLPIRGGWGYSLEDAIIIDQNDPVVNPRLPFGGVGLEHEIVEGRLLKEFLNSDNLDELYVGLEKRLANQSTQTIEGRTYDHLVFTGHCFWESDFAMLDEMYENRHKNADFDEKEYRRKREMLKFYFKTEYFFDVTSFYGKR